MNFLVLISYVNGYETSRTMNGVSFLEYPTDNWLLNKDSAPCSNFVLYIQFEVLTVVSVSLSSGVGRRVVWYKFTDLFKEPAASIITIKVYPKSW